MYADGRNRQLVENPLRYATDDLTVALGGIDEVESTANRLEILEGLKGAVNPDYLSAVPESIGKLLPLKEIHAQQREELGDIATRLDVLLTTYNSFVR